MFQPKRFQLTIAIILALVCGHYASAFSPSDYATTSKLSQGKWVKISVPEDGMYEITYAELEAMGFSDPTQVRVYGTGGHCISELLDGTACDDLKRVPILRRNNKICFYGNGPVAFSISDYNTLPHFTRVNNPYSQVGCYFLTEESGTDTSPVIKPKVTLTDYVITPSCLSFFFHENEMVSVSNTGKEFQGEDFASRQLLVDYSMPGIVDSTIVVNVSLAAKLNQISFASGILHSGGAADTTAFGAADSRLLSSAMSSLYYNSASPFAQLKLTHPAEQGQFEPFLKIPSSSYTLSMARLDYFILTYQRENVIRPEDDNQLLMGYANTQGDECFILPGASSSTVVWCVDDPNVPMTVLTSAYSDGDVQGLSFMLKKARTLCLVAFDPDKTLKKVASFEPVHNQNLHGMPIPDFLIITPKAFMSEAQRLADLHRSVDGMDVAVVDHEQIFNEFSSGTRDAMAYRLFCKMLYDRDNAENRKFKNVLLFGSGTFDNRSIVGDRPNLLLTYESDISNSEEMSFTTDDFFGFMEDNSGSILASDKLSLGIGRITCTDLDEAKSDVDKIVEYYATPDYGVWRNNTLVITDSPDKGLFMYQGEGYKSLIDERANMHVNTVHDTQYPRSIFESAFTMTRKTATVAKRQLGQFLKDGMYFATYVGHANPNVLTRTNKMWTVLDVTKTIYPHWPVMSTACCDVAHFDCDSRGIAELMFHQRNGGAIALLTSARKVYSTSNDLLNTYFMNGLFSYETNGVMPTLGEAYRQSKLGFENMDGNKLSFFLLGDPAMKFNYPVSRFRVTKVNGTALTDSASLASINPLSKFEVEAQVVNAEGNLDQSFNGDAILTLYDKEILFTSVAITDNGVESDSRDVYFNRPKLAELTGRVTNGVFRGMMIAPKTVLAKNEDVLLRTYAHKDNSDYMVNGGTKQVKMLSYDADVALTDTVAPIITDMYINDENSFENGVSVGSEAMLYITVTDDEGINVQSNSMECGMTLLLDGGTSYGDIGSYVTMGDGCRMINIEFPLENLSPGMHTLTYTVFDMMGNCATNTISFMVGETSDITLVADKWPAYLDEEVNFDLQTTMILLPEVTIRVTDATGRLVWMEKSTSFPVAWDMRDMNGEKVPAGLYRYFGTYSDGSNFGGTPINKLIVLDPYKKTAISDGKRSL